MKIIVDAMGGDNAPQAPVMGAIQANEEYGVEVTLVGRGEEILKVLEDNGIKDLPAGVERIGVGSAREMFEAAGVVFSGINPQQNLVEIVEIPDHPFFIASQFHPEFTSRPMRANPLFYGFIRASLMEKK